MYISIIKWLYYYALSLIQSAKEATLEYTPG